MKVLGLITEYNPFHYGHKYHLQKSLEVTGASHTIAIMSGSFVQRGEPSLVDKWTKAKMAIANGMNPEHRTSLCLFYPKCRALCHKWN